MNLFSVYQLWKHLNYFKTIVILRSENNIHCYLFFSVQIFGHVKINAGLFFLSKNSIYSHIHIFLANSKPSWQNQVWAPEERKWENHTECFISVIVSSDYGSHTILHFQTACSVHQSLTILALPSYMLVLSHWNVIASSYVNSCFGNHILKLFILPGVKGEIFLSKFFFFLACFV